MNKHRTLLEATRKCTEVLLWDFIYIFDAIYTYISPTQDQDFMANIDQYMNIIKEVLVDILNEYSPTKLPKLKKNLKNMVNMLRAKLHHNRSIIAVSFSFIFLFEDVKRMQLMYTDLLSAVNYSRKFISVKQKLATPKYMQI